MNDPRLLGNRYELGDVLGRGGMAEVRYGRDLRLGRVVAIKMLRVDYATDATFQERFRREAQSAASLNHRNVVAVYDTGEDYVDGNLVPYIVMEYVEGRTLRDLLRERARFTAERSIEIAAGILDALEYSHRAGIVHRDIKPGNVMINGAGEVKVMDFGIARSLAETGAALTQTAAVVGTAQYISPEGARGESADARSDIYALGCVLYELLTGRPPFVGESVVSVAVSHVREFATPPSALDPSIPRDLDSIILKSLAKDRNERYQSAYEMRADLERCAAGLPVAAEATAATQFIGGGYNDTMYAESPYADDDVVDDYDEEDERKGMSWGALIGAALAILAVAGLIGFLTFRPGGGETELVRVGSFVGDTQEEVEAWAAENDVNLTIETREVTDEAQEGIVQEQNPDPGTDINPETDSVTIWVGISPDAVTVPNDLIGMDQRDAEQAIRDAGLEVGPPLESRETTNEDDVGTVFETDPSPGSDVQPGTAVSLGVFTSPEQVTIPDLRGMTRTEAISALIRDGLEVGEEFDAPDDQIEEGRVVRSEPGGGQRVDPGTEVDLIISTGPEVEMERVPLVTEDASGNPISEANATAALTNLGFVVDVRRQPTCETPEGFVIGQNPQANTEVERGSTVEITVSEDPGDCNDNGEDPPEDGED